MTTTQQPDSGLAELDRYLTGRHLRGQWHDAARLEQTTDGPPPAGVPFVWPWPEVRAALTEMCESASGDKARRHFTFVNPGIDHVHGTSHTIAMGMQITEPGEIATAHRHSINALRFVVEGGEALYTVVDGEKLAMEPGDLIMTPAYTWHDHHNETDEQGIWIDILDVPLVAQLRQTFFEPFGASAQPLHASPADWLSARSSTIRPAWERRQELRVPVRYPWKQMRAALDSYAACPGSPFDGVILRYAHPVTGGPTLPTIDCFAQLLTPRLSTQPHRHTSSTVYYVVEGEGATTVGDARLNWSAGDSFVVPNWMWHAHHNNSITAEAVLFSATDAPVLTALGFYREDPGSSFSVQPPPAVPGDLVRAQSTAPIAEKG
ncbi:cupin domain-containing protein [Mycolicibacterium sphagni]|uniref:cupin domain-containing protein n=1 Tax=Mycolicibacterium sphagni TaxID=1786 RepID=UPI0021F2CE5D|nr:cupin domain-containing protein [Mycolicibacterium sphagni]MCV7177072.1 cupin domain-containing protein [Mycolicibacterium sphagni]